MNITFVSDSIYPYHKGGKEKRLYELSVRLSAMGHDVHIYTMHWWSSPQNTILEEGVQLHAICKLIPMYKEDKRSIYEGVLFGLACLKLFRVKFDVLDVDHMPFFPIFSSWLVAALRGKRLYGTWHEALSRKDWTSYMGLAGNIAAIIERISIHLPYLVTAASTHTRSLISTELKRTKRVELVASGIDFAIISKLKPVDARIDVLYVGRLVKDKRVDIVVRAVGIVSKMNPDIRACIIGHGIEHRNIANLIKYLGLEEQITLLDPLPNSKDVYSYMKASKLFCLPSIREGFGIVALEALACGTPVVTTNSPANAAKDLIREGQNGSVVPVSAEAFASALSYWLQANIDTGSVAAVAKEYDWNALAIKQVNVYSS